MNKFLTLVRSNLFPSASQGLNWNTKIHYLKMTLFIRASKSLALDVSL